MIDPEVSVHSYVVIPDTAKYSKTILGNPEDYSPSIPEDTNKNNVDEIRKDPIMDNNRTFAKIILLL